jgi:hypothetical protein
MGNIQNRLFIGLCCVYITTLWGKLTNTGLIINKAEKKIQARNSLCMRNYSVIYNSVVLICTPWDWTTVKLQEKKV